MYKSGVGVVRGMACLSAMTFALWATEPAAFAVTGDGGGGYESEQGPWIFGTMNPALEGVAISYDQKMDGQRTTLQIQAGQLQKQRSGGSWSPDVANLTLAGTPRSGPAVTLVISAARPHLNIYTGEAQGVWEYAVEVKDATGSHPLCEAKHNTALAIPGAWDARGALSAKNQDTWFSFACVPIPIADLPATNATRFLLRNTAQYTVQQRQALGLPVNERGGPRTGGGAAAKCIDYGYAPWVGGVFAMGRTTRTGKKVQSSEAVARRFHNLCTRAMTADYEANGSSHTIPGTVIRIFDLTNLPYELCKGVILPAACSLILPSQPTPAPPLPTVARPIDTVEESLSQLKVAQIVAPEYTHLYYESAWIDDGVTGSRPMCLAKLRWQTIDAAHIGQISYPPSTPGPHGTWTYCEGRTLQTFAGHDTEPVLVVYSAINEKGLYRFNLGTDAAPRWITTSRVQQGSHGIELSAGIPCGRSPCLPSSFEGDVLSADAPADTRAHWTTVPLYLYRNDAGHYALIAHRPGTGPVPTPPDGYHLVKHPHAPAPSPAVRADAASGARPAPAAAQKVSASQGVAGSLSLDVVPEGYLFETRPVLPGPSHFTETGAEAGALRWWKHGASLCTAGQPCDDRYTGNGQSLGYLLLPNATAIQWRDLTRPTTTPGHLGDPIERAHPGERGMTGPASAPVAPSTDAPVRR
jgi:hypothetical protein